MTEADARVLRTVRYGSSEIQFELRRANRETLEIAVLPGGSVVVKAPRGAREEDVLARVARRARWVTAQQRYFAQFEPRTPPRRYVGGETHLYLGRQYRLAIERGDAEGVRMAGGWFRVTVATEPAPEHVRELLDLWYTDKARRRLAERIDECWLSFPSDGLRKPRMRLRRMRTRWGSLSPGGTLSLHPHLVRAPRECIDYVITHELCHLVCADHGPGFHRLLERILPDWKRRKRRLERMLA